MTSYPKSSRTLRIVRIPHWQAFTTLALTVGVIALVVTGCAGDRKVANPLSSRAYIDHALQLMQANAVYVPVGGWQAVTDRAHQLAEQATTPGGTYPAILYTLDQLRQAGDLHARFTNAFTAKLQASAGAAALGPSPPPSVSLVNGRLGLIELPGIASVQQSPNWRRYVSTALAGISRLQARHHPCGWIVDLRNDTGGSMSPMLLSVGPILGGGRLIGFTGKRVSLYYVSYRNGVISGGGERSTDRAPITVPDFRPTPPVAVLTGVQTASAGEVVTVAFRGRANTRSFGTPTAGATTVPRAYRLADGAQVIFAVAYYVDRHGTTVYKHPIAPDVSVPSFSTDPASRWLLSTKACSRTH